MLASNMRKQTDHRSGRVKFVARGSRVKDSQRCSSDKLVFAKSWMRDENGMSIAIFFETFAVANADLAGGLTSNHFLPKSNTQTRNVSSSVTETSSNCHDAGVSDDIPTVNSRRSPNAGMHNRKDSSERVLKDCLINGRGSSCSPLLPMAPAN